MNRVRLSSLRSVAFGWIIVLILFAGSDIALAQASKDCAEKSGNAAIVACTEAIRQNPRNANAYNNRATEYHDKGDFDSAIADYNEAIRLDPRDADYFYNRGLSYHKKGDIDRALADFSEAIRLSPKHAKAYYWRATVHEGKGDIDRALVDYGEAIRHDPKDTDSYYGRGTLHENKGDIGRALADYSSAIKLKPDVALYWNGRCWLLATTNRELARALSDCNRALQLAPNDSSYLDSRAFVYFRLGQFKEAIADYDAALKSEPNDAHYLYGRGLAKLKDGDEASGNADITAAKAIDAKIVETYEKYLSSKPVENCRSGATIQFDAKTERGIPVRPDGIIVKLVAEQCGFTALWVPAALIGPNTEHCKFGQIISVIGSESKPVPPGGPFSGEMLVVNKMTCLR